MRGEVVEEVPLDGPSFFDTSQLSVVLKYKAVVVVAATVTVVVAVHVDDTGGVEEDMVVLRMSG